MGCHGNFSAGAHLDRFVGALTSAKAAEDQHEERIRQVFSLIYKGFLKDHTEPARVPREAGGQVTGQ